MAPPASTAVSLPLHCPVKPTLIPVCCKGITARPDHTGHLLSHSETGELGLREGIRTYFVKEGGRKEKKKKKRAGLFHSDPDSEIPCCGAPDRRQLKAIRIQLLSGCTVQQQQQQAAFI